MYLRCKARASLQVRARLLADDVGRAAARRLQPTARDHLGSELSTVVNSDTPPIDRRGPRSTTPGGRNGARWTANLHRESNASQHERLDLVPCSGTLARHRRRSVACAAERRSPVSQVRCKRNRKGTAPVAGQGGRKRPRYRASAMNAFMTPCGSGGDHPEYCHPREPREQRRHIGPRGAPP